MFLNCEDSFSIEPATKSAYLEARALHAGVAALNATQHAGHLSGVRPIHSTNHREGGDSRVPHQPDSVGARSANQGGYMGSAEINVVQADSAGCVVTPPYNGSKMVSPLECNQQCIVASTISLELNCFASS